MPTLADLGQIVLQKYPGSYDGLDPSEIGRRVQKKYPGAYTEFQDPAPQAQQPQQPQQAAPPVSMPGPGAGSPSASGFGSPQMGAQLTPPPAPYRYADMMEDRRRSAKQFDTETEYGAREHELRAVKQAEITASRAEIDRYVQTLKEEGVYEHLTPLQKSQLKAGKNITTERPPQNLPGYVSGKTILAADPGALTALGEPVRKEDFHRIRVLSDGTREYMAVAGGTTKRSIIDAKDGKSYLVTFDRNGNELDREETINPMMLPQVSSNSNSGNSSTVQQLVGPDNMLHTVQVPNPHSTTTTSTTQRQLPAGIAAPTAAPTAPLMPPPRSGGAVSAPPAAKPRTAPTAAAPATAPATPDWLPKGARDLGTGATQYKLGIQNPWTPQAIAVMNQIEPRVKSLERMEAILKTLPKGSRLTPERAAYALGFQGDVSKLLTELNMSGITSSAALLKGTSRAVSVLDKAAVHTPQDWKDEVGLMMDKISVMKTTLNDIASTAKKYGLKNPGLPPPPAARKPLGEIFN